MGLAVVLGAFGAHALHARLEAAGELATWETAVRFQAWQALGLIGLGLFAARGAASGGLRLAGWLLSLGSLAFSGSLYGLALEGPAALFGPVTPLGGLAMIAGWGLFAWSAWRGAPAR
jgi:uncharacterized membrane protein YgdD (TMEM256/DUF423 family)